MAQDDVRIAGAGICCLDYLFTSQQIAWGDTGSIGSFSIEGGGLTATALVACARLGARCGLYSLLGDDEVSKTILAGLDAEGVSTAGVVLVPGGRSPFSIIHVDERSGERTIFHRSGSELESRLPRRGLPVPSACDALVVDTIYPALALEAARVCASRGTPVIADMVPCPENREILPHVDVLIAPRRFAVGAGLEHDLPAALQAIHAMGPATAVITLGADGWIYSDPAGTGRGRAFPVKAVDTTGAGDAFHGAFALGRARGWDTPRCCELASAVAAISCTKPGGRAGLPRAVELQAFLKRHGTLGWRGVL